MTQTARLRAYLLSHPQASSLEIIEALAVTNATGRISDLRSQLRAEGGDVQRVRRLDGRDGYVVVEPGQGTLGLAS